MLISMSDRYHAAIVARENGPCLALTNEATFIYENIYI